jgi:hypothetical protein
MTHQSSEVIVGGLLRPWSIQYSEYYPGVREHFSEKQLARIAGLAEKHEITLGDKLFLLAMYTKLILTAI